MKHRCKGQGEEHARGSAVLKKSRPHTTGFKTRVCFGCTSGSFNGAGRDRTRSLTVQDTQGKMASPGRAGAPIQELMNPESSKQAT